MAGANEKNEVAKFFPMVYADDLIDSPEFDVKSRHGFLEMVHHQFRLWSQAVRLIQEADFQIEMVGRQLNKLEYHYLAVILGRYRAELHDVIFHAFDGANPEKERLHEKVAELWQDEIDPNGSVTTHAYLEIDQLTTK
jgi:hypothetical protein